MRKDATSGEIERKGATTDARARRIAPTAALPIDESELLKRWANNRPLCATLVRKFEAQIHNDMARMEGAAGAGDMEQLGFLAHSLKGAAAYVAAAEIHRAAAAVEAAAKANESEKAVESCGRLCALLWDALPRLTAIADRIAYA